MRTFALHGLAIASDVPLDAWEVERAPGTTIVAHPTRPIPTEQPAGTLLSHIDAVDGDGRRLLSVVQVVGGFLLRYHGLAEFAVSPDLSSVSLALDPSAPEEMGSLIAGAGLGAFLVTMGADIALHAGAFRLGNQVVAIVGDTGFGKSTLATLACASGAELVTDDTLRVGVDEPEVWCYPGSRSVRLRTSAAGRAGLFPLLPARTSPDHRAVLELARSLPEGGPLVRLPLAAVVLPDPEGGCKDRRLRRLSPQAALARLLPCGRMWNVIDPAVQARHFAACAVMARSVPAYSLSPPERYWLSPDLGAELVGLLPTVPAG